MKNKRAVNARLKTALLEEGMTQRDLARRARVSEFYISMNINGRYILSEQDKIKICAALGRSEQELFANGAKN